MSPGRDERKGASTIRRSSWLVAAMVVVGVYAAGLVFLGGRDALEAVIQAAPLPLAGAFVLGVLLVLIWPMVHRASLRAVGVHLGYGAALETSMTLLAISHTIPGGGAVGGAAAVERLGRHDVAGPAATASIALTGLLSVTTICGIGAIGLAIAVVAGLVPGVALLLAAAVFAVLLLVAGGVVGGLHSPRLGHRVIDLIGRIHHRLERRTNGWRASWDDITDHAPGVARLAPIFAWCTAKWVTDIGMLALVFLAFGASPHLIVLLVGFGASQVLAAIPATPGAVGFVEGGMVGAFATFGVPTATAAVVVLTYRIFETWLPALAGMPVALRPRDRTG